jgi:ankyrin repeat protein
VNLKCLNGDTALHFAFKNRNYEIIIMLIESNGDLNILNDKGQTPLAFGDKNLLSILNLTCGVTHKMHG